MRVVFLVPARNEEKGIGRTIDEIRSASRKLGLGRPDILVVDGHSTDRTVAIAKARGAKVLVQRDRGKGAAVIEAVATIPDSCTVVMTDADSTYSLAPLGKMLELSGRKKIIQGRRVITRGSMTLLNRFGNLFFNALATLTSLHLNRDILTGFRVFNAGDFKSLRLGSRGFDIESEMTLKALKKGFAVVEVPCSYTVRAGQTSLHPFRDGLVILKRIIREI
jgi:dolichol-phosphate mannosyltransferase